MTWEELVEKAKEFGYVSYETVIASNDHKIFNHTMFYYRDGIINAYHFGKSCFVADHRTPDQMYQIMLNLKE